MKKYNPIGFSLILTFAPAGILYIIYYADIFLGIDENDLFMIFVITSGLYLLLAPLIAIGSFLYMALRQPEWMKKYRWILAIYILLAIGWWSFITAAYLI